MNTRTQDDLSLLDRAVLGLALIKVDMDYRDKWAIRYGKCLLALSLSGHVLLFCRDVLSQSMPSRLETTILGFMIGALFYVPIHFLTRPLEDFQDIELSWRSRWIHRVWGLIIGPLSLLVWIPLRIFVL